MKMRFFGFLMIFLFCALLGTSNQQLSSLLGYQTSSGVREALLALNAFCGMLYFWSFWDNNHTSLYRQHLLTTNKPEHAEPVLSVIGQPERGDRADTASLYDQHSLHCVLYPKHTRADGKLCSPVRLQLPYGRKQFHEELLQRRPFRGYDWLLEDAIPETEPSPASRSA